MGVAALTVLLFVNSSSGKAADISLCSVMQSPEKYDGQELTMTVGYRVGFEWQELVCAPCKNSQRVWVEFDPDLKGGQKLGKSTGRDSLFRVRIRGVFVGVRGHYGHLNGYEYQFLVKEVLSANRLWQMTPLPPNVPANTAASACQP